jgi:uridine kinase
MGNTLTITLDGREFTFPRGTTFMEAAAAARKGAAYPALAAVMGDRLHALGDAIPASGNVCFLDITAEEGSRIYARSASFLLVRAVRELFAGARVVIDHSINQALYCEAEWKRRLTPADLAAVGERMREIAARDEPFIPVTLPAEEARAMLTRDGRNEAAALVCDGCAFSGYRCGEFTDTWYGPLAPSTGYVRQFRLHSYVPGFMLVIPHMYSPGGVPAFREMPKLSAVYHDSAGWERLIGVDALADLNRAMKDGAARNLVRMGETRQERKLTQIADMISRERRRVILVAGPSSSGKTTFAQRLTVHLNTYGLKPLALSLDDYYLDRSECPKDENGHYDLESIGALDIPLFEEQISSLLAGDAVRLAKFDFLTGRSVRDADETSVSADQPLIIEGINGLNDALTRFIPAKTKFRIFVSALTQLNIDDHNRVATTDVRFLRRMVRDHLFRGHPADKTIESWPGVHAAEFKNIFPHQENADVIFNSALVYELAALKPLALPLLKAIPEGSPSRVEAERLIAFLSLVEALPCPDEIPPTSIVREFIGGCTFYV